ncbi:MAG: Asp-tRNA(Asn)/Glu-tRNA(Gln) amidotransferase subunit GatA [Rubellimicrobium sp.]|nr:Asp-tRNA(Asn)/Glu-tRNA(Gln) amidotransferase subunit GatA [Rubellimicrobium sp.]
MTKLNTLTIAAARDGLRKRDFTAAELAEACLGAMDEARALNAFALETGDEARRQAAAADTRLGAGAAPDLCGIPLGIKDNLLTRGTPTQAGSRILEGFVPPFEGAATTRLWQDGAVMLGKLNLDELAMGVSTATSVHGPALNPWRADGGAKLSPGDGATAAVAARIVPGAIGSDTGGSLRQPASWAGVVGMKPTWGRVGRSGLVAVASSLDQIGPVARDVRDAAILLGAIAGRDAGDSTSSDREVPDFEAALSGDIRGRVVGIPRQYRDAPMDDAVAALWERGIGMLRDAGAEVRDIVLPNFAHGPAVFATIMPAEASSNLARLDGVRFGYRAKLGPGEGISEMYDRTRAEGLSHEVQRRLMIGTHMLSSGFYEVYFNHARKVRRLIAQDFETAFESGVELILTPGAPTAAPAADDPALLDAVTMYDAHAFTVGASLAGLPAISVPAGTDAQGLPLGLQLIGRAWDEAGVLNAAFSLERAAGFVASPARWW